VTAVARERRRGDLGRRIRHQRELLGLSVDEVARRARMAPGTVEYAEREGTASLDPSALWRLADALEVPLRDLLGIGLDAPPGSSPPRAGSLLVGLSVADCRRLLGDRGIGRLVFTSDGDPVALPLNYVVVDDVIVVRTAADGAVAEAARSGVRVGFEVDHIDDALSEGWSVSAVGHLGAISAEQEAAAAGMALQPWAGDGRAHHVGVHIDDLAGRRVGVEPHRRSADVRELPRG
jgi:transcriptional regulator with XRE-family HTH domain